MKKFIAHASHCNIKNALAFNLFDLTTVSSILSYWLHKINNFRRMTVGNYTAFILKIPHSTLIRYNSGI